jgi:hypothetical protein
MAQHDQIRPPQENITDRKTNRHPRKKKESSQKECFTLNIQILTPQTLNITGEKRSYLFYLSHLPSSRVEGLFIYFFKEHLNI